MSAAELIDLAVCTDCLQFAAGISAHERGAEYPAAVLAAPERVSRDNGGASVTVIPGGSDDEGGSEAYFSWSPCELCLSTLGGDRHAATLILEGPAQ